MSATLHPANRPYRWLADYYDRLFTFHADWFEAARESILGDVLPRVKSACDLCCGTGTTALALARRGIRMSGVDFSPRMVRQARAKARAAGVEFRVERADMRRFRVGEQVDLVLCEFDALNHVDRKQDLALVARAVARALRPGGWFFFDVNNRLAFEKVWPGTWFYDQPDLAMVMHGGYDSRRDRGWTECDWFIREGRRWRRQQERVEQVAWTETEMRRTLRAAGFSQIQAWDTTQFRPSIPAGARTFYLATKAGTFQPSTVITGGRPPRSRGR